MIYYILTLLLGMALSSTTCGPETLNPTPDPTPDTPVVEPEIPVGPIGDGNVGPRANTHDDPANGIYVSPTGNDNSADGSISKPFKSINSALNNASSGATIILRNGTYKEGAEVRVRIPNITIKSAKGEWGIIELPYSPATEWDSGIYIDVDASGFTLQSVEVIGGFYAVSAETMWDWGQPDKSGASNITIEDCILHDSTNDAVKIKPNCQNVTIRYNEIYNSGRAYANRPDFNTGENNSEGIDNVNGDKMHVHNNYIHDICSTGIYAKGGAADVIIENNIIERTFAAGIQVGFDTNLEFMEDGSEGPGFDYYENIRGIVRNNLIIDAGWEGIGLYASKDAQVYNNTIVNAVCGVYKYHSPIYFGIAPQDGQEGFGHPANVNPRIHHNIVRQPTTFENQMIEIRYSDEYGGMSALSVNPTMNDNCYFIVGKSASFTDNRPGNIFTGGLAAWKTHISGESGTIEVDPALGTNNMPTNAQCAGMGISTALTK